MTPSILDQRERARRDHCRSNLRALGLALHNYYDAHRTFPPGWVQLHAQADGTPGYGWQTSILPFVQQNNLYNSVDFNRMPAAATPLLQTAVRMYRDFSRIRGAGWNRFGG